MDYCRLPLWSGIILSQFYSLSKLKSTIIPYSLKCKVWTTTIDELVIDNWKEDVEDIEDIEDVDFSGVNNMANFINDSILDFLNFGCFDSHGIFYSN